MTLALYGKSRRRQGVLVLLALVVIMAAIVGGATLRPTDEVQAATANLNPTAASCSDSSRTEDDAPSQTSWDCTEGATFTQLSATGSSVNDNSATGRVNLETDDSDNVNGNDANTGDDDLSVTFTISSLSGTINTAKFVVTSAAADDAGTLQVGTASNKTRHGNVAPGTSVEYTTNVVADLQAAVTNGEATYVLNLAMDCNPDNDDCGTLVDRVQLVVDYTPAAPDLQVLKVAQVSAVNVTSVTLPSANFNWLLTLSNQGTSNAVFAANSTVLTDQLPTSGATYGATPTDSSANMACTIVTNLMTCTSGGSGLTIGVGASITVTIAVTPTAAGTLSNPRSGGTCSIDPSTLVTESNEANNACTPNTVTVNPAAGPVQVTNDVQGVNDEPGQKDLTRMSVGTVAGGLAITWNWDDLGTNGANTLDACSLYDTDGDGMANFSLCQTTTGDPGTALATTLYSCNDANADRCNGNAVVPGFTSTCTVGAGVDPFVGGDFAPVDRQASCNIVLADFGGGSATLIDVCSYPSQQPNSDPSDCVVAQTGGVTRTIRVMKVTGTATHPAAVFSGTISPGGDTAFSVSLAANVAVSAADDNIVSDQAQTVTETTLPADWANAGYYVQAASGNTLYTCSGTESYTNAGGSAAVPAGNGDYTVCIKNTYTAPDRTLRVMKVTGSATHPAQAFVGTISPGADTAFSVTLPLNTAVSAADSGSVSTAAQTVTETPVPVGWLQAGYYVHEDVSGPYTCTGSESYTNVGGSAAVPAGSSNYTVCIKNTYNPGSIVVHKELGGTITSAPTWSFQLGGGGTQTVVPAGGTTTFSNLAPGSSYSITETNGSVATCGSVPGSFTTTSGTSPNPSTPGTSVSNIVVTAGQATDVYFKNTPCPATVGIAKSSSPEVSVAAGGSATWTITVTVGVNPTAAARSITDTLPSGFTINGAGVAAAAFTNCPANIGGTFIGTAAATGCTLPAGTVPGQYTISIPVLAPANFPFANCTTYTNTAYIIGGASAPDSILVTGCVDPSLALSKSNNAPTPLASGGTFTWTVKATITSGPTVATATIVDTVPGGFTIGTVTTSNVALTCGTAAQLVTCTLPAGAVNGDYYIYIPVTAPTVASSTQCGLYTNSATASFPANQGNVTGSPATSSVTITCPALSIVKSAVNGTVNLGSDVQFDLLVTNTSTVPATGIAVSDTLPSVAGLVWNASPVLTFTPNTPVGSCSVAGNVLSCTGITLAPGANVRIRVTATTSTATTRAICALHTNPKGTATVVGVATDSGSASVTVNCPSITIAKVANPAGPVTAGAAIGWTFTIQNTSAIVATNVSVTDALPAHTGVVWSGTANTTSGAGSCAVTGAVGAQELNCTGLTVPASGSITVSVTGTTTAGVPGVGSCGTITNTGATATLLGTVSNQLAAASVDVNCPDPTVSKSGNGPVTAGDTVTFTVTVTAGGTGSQNVVLTDVMPGTGLSWTAGGANAVSCSAGPVSSGSAYTCTFNNLTSPETRTVTFSATSTPAMCAAGPLQNTATINSTGDVNPNNNSANASITVNCPSVTLTKVADAPTTVSAGSQIGFVITATNSGPGIARDFVLTDTLPANITGWAITGPNAAGCAIVANVLRCPAAGDIDLAANGGSMTVHVIGTSTPAACGTVTNTATAVVSNQVNAIPNAPASVTVNCPDVTVLKTADNGTISAGDTAAFTILVSNVGLGTATNVTLSDQMPAGITWSEDSADCSINGSGLMTCSWATLAPAATKTIHVSGVTTAANCAIQSNTATVGAVNEPAGAAASGNSSTANIGVNCAEISVVKTPDATPVNATDGIGFTITAKNLGVGTARNVTVNDTLPSNGGLAWTESPNNTECSIAGFQLTCNFGDLVQNQEKSVHVISPTTVASCGTINNTAGVTTTNDGTGSSATAIVVNCPNVTVTKTKAPNQPDPVSAGETISFQIAVSVSGTGTAYNVTATDTFPANTSQWSVTNDPADADACGIVAAVLSCNFGSVTAPKTFTITVTGKAIGANGAVTCGPVTNTATVAAGNESNANDNTSSATVGVNCPAIGVVKTAVASPINAGDLAKFKVTVSNTGLGTATGVTVSDSLPNPGLGWTIDPAVPGCAIVVGVLNCSGNAFASMAPSTSIDIYVSATTTPAVCGVLNNYAYVSANNDNVEGLTESNLAMITVNCPDVSLVKSAGSTTINAGDVASFTLSVKNLSTTGSAYGVTLTDDLPASTIGWTDNRGDCSIDGGGKLTCTIGTMAPQATFSVTVTGTTTPAQCGTLSNQGNVAATNEPAGSNANNTSTATITVNCPDIEVIKSPDGLGISAGENAVFTILVSNLGTGTAYDVELTDTLPAGLTWTDDSDACDVANAVLTCKWNEMAPGKATITLTAPTTPAQCGALPNSASATASNEADGATSNNSDTASITVACPDIDVVKTAVNDPINPGEDAEFTITIHNAGPGNAIHVILKDQLPAGLNWTEDSEACAIVAGALECAYKQVDSGDTIVIELSAPTTTAQCGLMTNTATITLDNEAADLIEDNTSTDTITVACGTIQVIKIDQVEAADPERPSDWDFTITGPNGFNESRSVALGGGSATITNVPLGAGYSASEVQARFGACPVPNETGTYRTTGPGGSQSLTQAGQTITFTFTNVECGIVLSTGSLIVNKVSDTDGDHVQDAGEPGISGWAINVQGPEFPGGQQFFTDANGRLLLPGIKTGSYTVSEVPRAGYQAIGVVTEDNSSIFSANTSTTVSLEFSDTDTVTFFNQPQGTIVVHKTTLNRVDNISTLTPDDDDGWRFTVKSTQCGVDTAALTDSNGNATFSKLPLCGDYVVTEDLSVSGGLGYTPAGSISRTNVVVLVGATTTVNFINERVSTTPPCSNCNVQPTPTPSATNTPAPTGTPIPATNTPAPKSPSPVSTQAGEKTPGPASPTPIAPSTGAGWAGTPVGNSSFLLFLIGLLAVAGGLSFIAMGRKSRSR